MNLSLLSTLCYTAGWFWCVLFGINDQPTLAAAGALLLILLHLYYTKTQDISLYIQDWLLAIFSVPLGILLEIFFIQITLVHYTNTENRLPPIWIVCLYPLFSLLLNHSLKKIKKNYLVSFLVGFLGAPMSYVAGISLGGLTFPHPFFQSLIIIGISWGAFLCLLVKITRSIYKATVETLSERDSNDPLDFLYDGECPICKREICMLKQKDHYSKIQFTDISSKEFLPSEHSNIDYKTAMSQIHAIDVKGNLLVGLPAFAAVYARCQLLLISTLLRIPFIQKALAPLYKIFAKNRLRMTGKSNTTLNK